MAPKDSNDCVVTVTIELGHQANFLKEPSPEGFTHDWTVFVRGYEGSRLEYFVEKVVFKLHKTFKSPVRVISEPPFRVTESGYAGFILPIEIHFRNKQTPRKILFSYDLFLNAKDSPPINNVRYEKLKFQNPTPEFKAKLIKAGGSEQGAEQVPYELFGSPVRPEKKALPKIPKDKDKEKIKKKKSSPHAKSASPAQSLSSLSSSSSDNDDDDDGYTAPLPPPPPPKKEKEPPLKKDCSSSLSQPKQDSSSLSQPKQDSSSLSQPKQDSSISSSSVSSSTSSHKEKSKHRSSSSNSFHKERSISEKDATHKPHKHKEKDKERYTSTSHKDKEGVKKEKSSNPQKVVKDHVEARKEKESSLFSGKSVSSSQHDNKINIQMFLKDKEKSLHSKDKDVSSSSKEKSSMIGKERDKTSKEKHSSHKDVSPGLNSEIKKKEDTGKEKISKEKDRHDKKSHKRHSGSAEHDDDVEKKKLKKSSTPASTEDRSMKSKSTSGKEKNVLKESKDKESAKESKDKTSKSSSSSSGKNKHEKSRHSEKHRHSRSSESRQKEPSSKHPEMPQKLEKVSKSEILTQSERLAMTADFQPQLLLSPLKSKSDEEESPALSPMPVEEIKLKHSTSISSPVSQSSVSCDDANKSDHEILELEADGDKHIVSGLTDSDSDSDEETPYLTSPQKEVKSVLNKQGQQVSQVHKSASQKLVRRVSLEEKQMKMECESTDDSTKKHDISYKYSKEEKLAHNSGENKSSKTKFAETKMECSDDEVNVEQVSSTENASDHACSELGILAPNGISIGELIAINEKIDKAQIKLDDKVLNKIARVIGEAEDFDLDDDNLSFDICSINKNSVLQIQALLKEY